MHTTVHKNAWIQFCDFWNLSKRERHCFLIGAIIIFLGHIPSNIISENGQYHYTMVQEINGSGDSKSDLTGCTSLRMVTLIRNSQFRINKNPTLPFYFQVSRSSDWNLTVSGAQPKTTIIASIVYGCTVSCSECSPHCCSFERYRDISIRSNTVSEEQKKKKTTSDKVTICMYSQQNFTGSAFPWKFGQVIWRFQLTERKHTLGQKHVCTHTHNGRREDQNRPAFQTIDVKYFPFPTKKPSWPHS